jgi:Mlc titration factor MtfA (ptsG expression regulator)
VFRWWRRRRRARIRATPVPPAWREVVARNVPFFRRLLPDDQEELLGHVQVFLAEKTFEGCDGLEVTDEVRVTIAAQACVLLLHQEDPDDFADVRTVLVYPHAYQVPGLEQQPDGTVIEGAGVRLGEAWTRGEVVLSWDDVKGGAADVRDGHNVVLHEFAHKLDQEDGAADGAPVLPVRSRYVAWARALGGAYRELRETVAHHHRDVLDAYGATNPAEFFAVATECFFEKGAQLQKKHPALYEQLRGYYRQDPASLPPPRPLTKGAGPGHPA